MQLTGIVLVALYCTDIRIGLMGICLNLKTEGSIFTALVYLPLNVELEVQGKSIIL